MFTYSPEFSQRRDGVFLETNFGHVISLQTVPVFSAICTYYIVDIVYGEYFALAEASLDF